MELELAEQIYEFERRIECDCYITGCDTLQLREDVVGAVGMNSDCPLPA